MTELQDTELELGGRKWSRVFRNHSKFMRQLLPFWINYLGNQG